MITIKNGGITMNQNINQTNKWYNNAIIYHLYPLAFVDEKAENNLTHAINRTDKIYNWINHINDMNCNTLFLGPIFQSRSHGYDTTDLFSIDFRLGSNDEFRELIKELHNKGLKVIVDGVFNHVGRDFFAFKDLQENKENSIYKDWFVNVDFSQSSPYGDSFSYESWSGYFDLVKLNLKNNDVVNHLLNAVNFWIDTFEIDGIRLDCADVLDFDFMASLRTFCEHKKEDFWLLGEVIHGDYFNWANNERLYSTTNYECYKGLFSSHNDKNMFEIAFSLDREFNIEKGIYKDIYLYNFTDNHDVNRLASTVLEDYYLYTVNLLLFTVPGIPSVYYGSEWAVKGTKGGSDDWALRPNISPDTNNSNYNFDLENVIKRFINIRHHSESLKHGTYKQLVVKQEQFVFERKSENETTIVAINSSDKPVIIDIPMNGEYNKYVDILNGNVEGSISNNTLSLEVPAHWGNILRLEK